MDATMATAGLETVDTYVLFHQNTLTQFISTRPILDLCMEVERQLGMWVVHWWWSKEGINQEGVQMVAGIMEVVF